VPTTPTPAIPSFTDGTVVNASNLNALAANLTNLYNYNQASFISQRPAVQTKQTTGQSIPVTTDTLVNFQSATINTDNMWTASVPNTITIQHAGIYWVYAQVRYPGVTTSGFNHTCTGAILANGTAVGNAVAGCGIPGTTAGAGPSLHMGTVLNLAAGGTLFLNAWHSDTAAMTLGTDFGGSYLGAVFLTSST
jgi:hypothetical protein